MKTLILMLLCLSAVNGWAQCSPIVVDINKDGIHLGPAGRGVLFDVDADGAADPVQWVRVGGDEAFLSLDRNGNGVVDDGAELFGVGTPLFDGGNAPNGFVGLAQYDQPALGGNDDGRISAADEVWSQLSLWLDSDADGVSTSGEIQSPESLGIRSFATIPKVRRFVDEAGNSIPYWAWAGTTAPAPRKTLMVDVFFLRLNQSAQAAEAPAFCLAKKTLPG